MERKLKHDDRKKKKRVPFLSDRVNRVSDFHLGIFITFYVFIYFTEFAF